MSDILDSLNGKVALIMGSGKDRIGNYIAKMLADNKMNIAIHYRSSSIDAEDTVEELKKLNIKARSFKADINNESEIKDLIEQVKSHFGKIDLLVNTAAVYSSKKIQDVTTDDLDFFYKTNLRGTFLVSKYAGLVMKEQIDGGVIVNIGDWAVERPYKDYSAYFASKAGIETITKTLAVEFAPKVRVNYIHPGPILFPKDMDENEKQEAINKTLLKRQGSPKNIYLAVLYYILNDFTTGDGTIVDGGRHIF